jgi:hypothetical protein
MLQMTFLLYLLFGISLLSYAQGEAVPLLRIQLLNFDGTKVDFPPNAVLMNGIRVPVRVDAANRLLVIPSARQVHLTIYLSGYTTARNDIECSEEEIVCDRVVFLEVSDLAAPFQGKMRIVDFSEVWDSNRISQIQITHLASGVTHTCSVKGRGLYEVPMKYWGILVAIAILDSGKVDSVVINVRLLDKVVKAQAPDQ